MHGKTGIQPEKLIKNIVDQIKEAQIKLGYVKETLRLYYPAASLNTLLNTDCSDEQELLTLLENSQVFEDTVLGNLQFAAYKGRIEISVPPEGAEYVRREVPTPAFLSELIKLFGNHHCTLEDIKNIFQTYSDDYVCKKMPDGTDFDYVLYFCDNTMDTWYYCVKEEMGHMIYHRFTEADYRALLD